MRRNRLLPASSFMFLLATHLVSMLSGYPAWETAQDQPQRPKFYAIQVVSEEDVKNAKDSLGPPDGLSAEILPGGQLVVFMEDILALSRIVGDIEHAGCIDSGAVLGQGEMDFGLEGRFIWQDAQGEKRREWIHLAPTVTGFCIFPPTLAAYSREDKGGVDTIRITNAGTKSLFIEAVIGFINVNVPQLARS